MNFFSECTRNPLDRYVCRRCGACCRWEGIVRITDTEADEISEFLGCRLREFLERYTRLAPDRRGLVLADRADGACIFLEGTNRCRIYPVRPRQCRGFPNRWNFPGFRAVCRCLDRFEDAGDSPAPGAGKPESRGGTPRADAPRPEGTE